MSQPFSQGIKTTLFFITALSLLACNKPNQNKLKLITGEWTFVSINYKADANNQFHINPPYEFPRYRKGFKFYEDHTCDNKSGYFTYSRAPSREDSHTIYLGNKTKYNIIGDSLALFDLADKKWQRAKIYKTTPDSLILVLSKNAYVSYVKTRYNKDSKPLFDQLIISSSGCFGYCPINDIAIKSTGEVLFSGQKHNTINDDFTAKITKAKFDSIELSFKKAKLLTLKKDYPANQTDGETVSITFIKGDKIIKQIEDSGSAPAELESAYESVRYLYQSLKPIKFLHADLPFSSVHGSIIFHNSKHNYFLSKSEAFYLFSLIRKSPLTDEKFANTYIGDLSNHTCKQIATDGRIFNL